MCKLKLIKLMEKLLKLNFEKLFEKQILLWFQIK